jgi:hypothetical protein
MRPILITFFLAFLLLGCFSTRQESKLSEFSYNNKFYNYLIINRIPDYGITGADGCIVMKPIFLSLKSINDSQIIGTVKEITAKEILPGARVKIYFKEQKDSLFTTTDSTGSFLFTPKFPIDKIFVHSIGYRPLMVGFDQENIINIPQKSS